MCKFRSAGLLLLGKGGGNDLPSIVGGHKAVIADLVRYCDESYYEDAIQELLYWLLWLEKYYEKTEV